jgi:crotonobetainyl-CoA:carnitine CoA-transferase CaiB-like acyl-CoA transferase
MANKLVFVGIRTKYMSHSNNIFLDEADAAVDSELAEQRLQQQAVASLLRALGLSALDGCALHLRGMDPVLPSKHRHGLACSAALAVQGAAIAAIWKLRSGRTQSVEVDLRQAAVVGLRTGKFLQHNGYNYEGLGRSAALANFFETRDGRRMYLLRFPIFPAHLARLLHLLGCTESSTEQLAAAVRRWDALDLEDALAEHKLVGTLARSRAEWLAHPQGQWLAAHGPVHLEPLGPSAPESFVDGERPLSGVRVLDLTHVLAGPVCSRTLAEQGADVLHVTVPEHLDSVHNAMDTGFGKRSCFLDLRRPEDLQRMHTLVREADVLVQSWRPGVLDQFGLAPEDLARLRPGIVVVSVSCYGSGGPWRTRGGYEPVGQAVCGLASDEGSADQPLMAPTFTLNDYLAAYLAAAGAAAALLQRARHGGSRHVQVSLARCSMWVQELGQIAPARLARLAPASVPAALETDLMTTDGVFGRLTHARPITQFSETLAHWASGPVPPGADVPRWLPRAH